MFCASFFFRTSSLLSFQQYMKDPLLYPCFSFVITKLTFEKFLKIHTFVSAIFVLYPSVAVFLLKINKNKCNKVLNNQMSPSIMNNTFLYPYIIPSSMKTGIFFSSHKKNIHLIYFTSWDLSWKLQWKLKVMHNNKNIFVHL